MRILANIMMAVILLWTTGCMGDRSNKELMHPPANNDISEVEELSRLLLHFTPVQHTDLRMIEPAQSLQQARSIHYWPIPGQKEAILHIYIDSSNDDPFKSGDIYVYIQDQDKLYEVGLVGSYGLQDVDFSLADSTFDGMMDLLIQGGMGATYRSLRIIAYDASSGKWIQYIETGSPRFIDLDLDGVAELIAESAGSLPSYITIYRWNTDHFEQANISEQTGSDYAHLDHVQIGDQMRIVLVIGLSENQADPMYYLYEDGELIHISM